MLIGIPWLLTFCLQSLNASIRARGYNCSLEILVWHSLLRELVGPDRWVISNLGLRHARVHLRNHGSLLAGVVDAAGSRNPFDVALGCTIYLIALFFGDLFLLSPDGVSESIYITAFSACALLSCHRGV
jgi:hypothetical protein